MPVQDSLNSMLDEGAPYAEIIRRLGPHGRGLTKQKISRWRYGAHQDYLRKQDLATRARLLTEYAAELIVQPGADPDQVARVCREVAAGQMLTTLLDHGKDALDSALKSDPSTVFRLFNTICNVSESCLTAEKARHLFAVLPLQATVPPSPEQSRPVLDKHFLNERAALSTAFHTMNSVSPSPSQSHLVSDKKLMAPAPAPLRAGAPPHCHSPTVKQTPQFFGGRQSSI